MKRNRKKAAGRRVCYRSLLISLVVLHAVPAPLMAAELKGDVVLMEGDAVAGFDRLPANSNVSVVLYPLDGQEVEKRRAGTHELLIQGRHLNPAYITIARGEQVRFINQDELLHHIMGISAGQESFEVALDKRGGKKAAASVRFSQEGSWYLYCSMHRSVFGQIDVVESSYIQNMKQPDGFSFSGLAPGRWRVQASTLANSRSVTEAEAFSSPPSMKITLPLNTGKIDSTSE